MQWLARLCDWLLGRSRLSFGGRGERAAERFLRRKGYRILGRNVRLAVGEIDLIAEENGVIVFVEVKTRRGEAAGHPVEAVDEEKQRRLTRLALSLKDRPDFPFRSQHVQLPPNIYWKTGTSYGHRIRRSYTPATPVPRAQSGKRRKRKRT